MDEDIDPKALSAAIAGFLACHVLTCRFLVQEGIVDKDRFATYLETAMAEMAPGLEDPRTLFGLRQLDQCVARAIAAGIAVDPWPPLLPDPRSSA